MILKSPITDNDKQKVIFLETKRKKTYGLIFPLFG
jgi:hypothetical protein